MTYFVEVRTTKRRSGQPRLVPLTEISNYTGFRSVYAYDTVLVDEIKAAGSTGNLRGQAVYSETLLIDFDDHDPAEFVAYLRSTGIGFEAWDSGGRSVHIHIPVTAMYGPWVPAAQKAWVKKHAPTADISFYHPAGMYRLPRTIHEKHGRAKSLIESQQGSVLTIPEPLIQESVFKVSAGQDATQEQLYSLITQRQGIGNRSRHIWLISTVCAELGLPFDTAVEHLEFWNSNFAAEPHTLSVLVRQCESAYRRKAQ